MNANPKKRNLRAMFSALKRGMPAVFVVCFFLATVAWAEDKYFPGKSDGTFTVTADAPKKLEGGRDLPAIKERGTLVVAMYGLEDDAPFFFVNDDGVLVGLDVDIAKDVAQAIGVKLEINRSFDDYSATAEAVAAGLADIAISDLSDTEKRREIVDFPKEPYVTARLAVLVDLKRAAEAIGEEIEGASDLNDPKIKIAFEKGSSYAEDIEDYFPKATGMPYVPGKNRLQPIMTGGAHGLLQGEISMAKDIAENPGILTKDGGRFDLIRVTKSEDPISIAMPKNTPALKKAIQAVLDDMDVITPSNLLKKYPSPKQ